MNASAELLTDSENYAVVMLPNRRFPGVVFQGDSLHSVGVKLVEVRKLIASGQNEDADFEIGVMINEFKSILSKYEKVLNSRAITLPYSKNAEF